MKRFKTCTLFYICLLPAMLAARGAGAESAADSANMRFSGQLVALPCVIPPGKEPLSLSFGEIAEKYLYLNTRTYSRSFSISLEECDLSVGDTVRVSFTGQKNPDIDNLLALDAESQATGIAIGLETADGMPLPLDKETSAYQLTAGTTQIVFKAYVQASAEAIKKENITLGSFKATATFNLDYE